MLGKRAYWTLARLTFLFFAICFGLTGIGIYLFALLTSWYFFGDVRFWRYLKYFHGLWLDEMQLLYLSIFKKSYVFVTTLRLDAPPLLQPDPATIELQPTWAGPVEHCNGCHQCCLHINCHLLDRETGSCLSYGSFYWRYFNCGRFPINQAHLDYFGCPKWRIKGV